MASPQFETNRLNSEELLYELAIRGVDGVTTVDVMRKTLRALLKLEKDGSSIDYPSYPFSFDEDRAALFSKITEINALIQEFDGSHDATYKKIFSKYAYALGRVNRSKSSTDDEQKIRSKLIVDILGLKSDLEKKVKLHERSIANQTLGIPDLDLVDIADTSSDSDCDVINSTPIPSSLPSANKVQPIFKWNLKFRGENKIGDLSLSAFLERVEETRIARNASHHDLFNSGIDLFDGKALVWYRSVRKTVRDWNTLVTLLREEFQPPDYNDKLFDEIKRRTQGANESIGLYIAVMNNLFDRLTIKVTEATKLKILRNNIAPFYQTQLALKLGDITTTNELLTLGRKLEERKKAVKTFNYPPSRKFNSMLEPDLAYVDANVNQPSCSSNVNLTEVTSNKPIVCFNCNKPGHIARQCNEAPRKYCYRCKRPNFTIRTCPNCNSQSGNANQRR
ncbi:hypothetical protein NQ317_000059 [Molorchus minor]|uniref:CCHC-type domain-containing protein n=1 Tax=Molorchus minor TaxID=1323400 RepID=A0ABQ9JIU1_9CUCU|nr:hypothetical protein NQ317_000059 [Molorchus minor]